MINEVLQGLLQEIADSNGKILAASGSAGKLTNDNLGDINNNACDVAYYLGLLQKHLKIEQK